jgi:hypothetical protein
VVVLYTRSSPYRAALISSMVDHDIKPRNLWLCFPYCRASYAIRPRNRDASEKQHRKATSRNDDGLRQLWLCVAESLAKHDDGQRHCW